jgi:hypothetical protein
MIAEKKRSLGFLLLALACVATSLLWTTPVWGQNVQVDISSAFNTAGIFTSGTTFLGTNGMDSGFNCTPPMGQTNCPDAYSANQLGLSTAMPPTLTPPSLNIPFAFGPVNTTNCGPLTGSACINDLISLPGAPGATIPLPTAQQMVYSTLIMLGTAVNGSHTGTVTVTYGDGTADTFNQTFSDWCGFGSNQFESIAVGGIQRINSTGTLNGASCNLYAYTYSLNFNKVVASITLTNTDSTTDAFTLAMVLKPPTYTIDAAAASPTPIKPGSSSMATITVNPQPGYTGDIQLSCSISPAIPTNNASTAPSCSLSPTSVTVTAGGQPPTTTLTFNAAKPPTTSGALFSSSKALYAMFFPILGLPLIGIGSVRSFRRKLSAWLVLAVLLGSVTLIAGCVHYVRLGNVGTPPGPYTITVTGIDTNGLTQASNATGTTNQVVVLVND